MSRLAHWWGLLCESLDLILTLRPGISGPRTHKVFGQPKYGGGPRTKHAQLASSGAGRGEPYSTLVCLSAVRVPLLLLRWLRRRGARVVVNQNGVYYPLWYSGDWAARNAFLAGLNAAATKVFFQSQFSVDSYRKWVGELPEKHEVLINGVDRNFFRPDPARGPASGPARLLVFLDFKEGNRELWTYFAKLLPELRGPLVCMGRVEAEPLLAMVRASLGERKVEWVLSPSSEEVARTLRACDIALHFVYNDVCPNKVLECLASGVYVLCSSAGGAKELVASGGGKVLPVQQGYEAMSFPDSKDVALALASLDGRVSDLSAEARRASERFDLIAWEKTMTGDR